MTLRVDTGPLHGLQLATPRLELRLGSREELVALAHVAEDGIHRPEEMPFGVAWSDGIGSYGFVDGFVAYHEGKLAAWTPVEWHLNLLVWAGGTLAGTQSVRAELRAGPSRRYRLVARRTIPAARLRHGDARRCPRTRLPRPSRGRGRVRLHRGEPRVGSRLRKA